MNRIRTPFAAATMVLLLPASAAAHIALTFPAARYGQDEQKEYPCGMAGNPPGANAPTVLQAGDTITVTWDEFIDHDSHYRISISNAGDDAFINPTAFDDFDNSPTVVLDNIPDPAGAAAHQADIMVPDIPCSPCTLQLMQVMYGGTFGAGSLYYQCADIVIEGAAATSGGVDSTGAPDDSSGGAVESSDGADSDSDSVSGTASASATGATAGGSSEGGATTAEPTTSGAEPADDGAGGCGCGTQGSPIGLGLLLLAWPVLRRRR